MKKREMNEQVQRELGFIPKDRRYLPQGLLRSCYNAVRRHELSINPSTSAGLSLRRAIAEVKRGDPEATLHYDRGFFDL